MKSSVENEFKCQENAMLIDAKAKKFITIFLTSLFLLIPLNLMSEIIEERRDYKKQVIYTITKSWADRQYIGAPNLYFITQEKDNKKLENQFELNNYDIDIKITTEVRKKGIFKVPVYTAEVFQKGDFINKYGDLSKKELISEVSIGDKKGFIIEPEFKINNMPPQISNNAKLTYKLNTSNKNIPFEISYKIKGIEALKVLPSGVHNNINIQGDWKDPDFKGDFLPIERNITNKNFSAKWVIPKVATQTESGLYTSIIVSLLLPVDNYSMTDKALKYGFLLLMLTFIGYFIYEVTSKEDKKIHPLQYCLLGSAILIFYLLLVSISEFLSFNIAYLISTSMILCMIFMYTYFVITKKQCLNFAIGITSLIGGSYLFFYTLLTLQDIALLAGSIGLFIVIGMIMYFKKY